MGKSFPGQYWMWRSKEQRRMQVVWRAVMVNDFRAFKDNKQLVTAHGPWVCLPPLLKRLKKPENRLSPKVTRNNPMLPTIQF